MLTITTQEFIKFIRMFAGPSKCAIIFNDHDIEVRYRNKVNSMRYADSLGSLLDKELAFRIINNVRYRFQYDAINWNVATALDPLVSELAQELIERGKIA